MDLPHCATEESLRHNFLPHVFRLRFVRCGDRVTFPRQVLVALGPAQGTCSEGLTRERIIATCLTHPGWLGSLVAKRHGTTCWTNHFRGAGIFEALG